MGADEVWCVRVACRIDTPFAVEIPLRATFGVIRPILADKSLSWNSVPTLHIFTVSIVHTTHSESRACRNSS